MTALLTAPVRESYELEPALREPTRSLSIRETRPEEVDFEDLLLHKLGPRGWGRIVHFRRYYTPGWGQGEGKSLSPRAVEAFRRFLRVARFPDGVLPSVFLTDQGGLEVCWEDKDGKSVQVEFTSHGVDFYREAGEEEASVGFHQIPALAEQLSVI
jgi:hypothetical protein